MGHEMTQPNFANRTLYHGDNLDFLRGMNSGTVHLIATDPPFNKNKDFHATPDSLAAGAQFQDRWSWRDDLHDEWLIKIQRDEPEVWSVITTAKNAYGDGMAAFLCWMGVRLLEMHRVLRDDGSIYLHCDPTASHYLKLLMDAVFGNGNFRSEITWRRTNAKGLAFKGYPNNADLLLYYSRDEDLTWNRAYRSHDPKYVKQFYRHKEPTTGRLYRLSDLTNPNRDRPNLTYEWNGHLRVWRWTKERMQDAHDKGLIHYSSSGLASQRRYLDEMQGNPVDTIWDDIQPIQSQSKERTGYPTQKPLALYERIIKASSNPGDIVLDPFCGCATTPVAAERLGRQWVGMDIWDKAHQMVLDRLEAEGLAVPEAADIQRGQQALTFAHITYTTTPPKRTDTGEEAILYLRSPTGRAPRYPAPRTQHGKLLLDIGPFCQGCGRDYGFDPRVLEVDHVSPKPDGGTDAYDNLTLLCPPCNKEKRDRMTLSGLQDWNRVHGYLLSENAVNIRRGRAQVTTRRRRR